MRSVALAFMIAAAIAAPAAAQLTDQQIAAIIVKESREAYYRTGHPCACPEDLAQRLAVRAAERLQPARRP
jgi:hypothetical protein